MSHEEILQQTTRVLRSYADRGVFRGFVETRRSGGRAEVRFRWLSSATFIILVDPRRQLITLADLLPNVPFRSSMDRDFREFLSSRASDELPDHRRVDPRKVSLQCRNRKGSLSILLRVHGDEFEYALRKGISLINEIFHGFLRGPYFEYMVENFDEPEE